MLPLFLCPHCGASLATPHPTLGRLTDKALAYLAELDRERLTDAAQEETRR